MPLARSADLELDDTGGHTFRLVPPDAISLAGSLQAPAASTLGVMSIPRGANPVAFCGILEGANPATFCNAPGDEPGALHCAARPTSSRRIRSGLQQYRRGGLARLGPPHWPRWVGG